MLKPTLSEVIDHIRNRTYMGGVERDQLRVKATGEVFTPTELVREMLKQIPIEQFQDPTKTFLDNSCGDGQFLGEVLIRKMENGSTFEQALSTTYGVDLMQDNVDQCRERLLCGSTDPKLLAIVKNNIVREDALAYHYRFDGTPCDVVETKEEKSARIKKERDTVKKQKEQEKLAKKKQQEKDRAKAKAKKEREQLEKQAKIQAEKLSKALQREREKSERLAKKEELRFKREQSKSKLTILNPDLFEF